MRSDFKNFLRAGIVENRSFTSTVVPTEATSFTRFISPPETSSSVPEREPRGQVVSTIFATDAMEERASPRKPIVRILKRSSSRCSLLVACRSNARKASSLSMPVPLSDTLIRRFPPLRISMESSLLPASIAFSINSFTTDAGLSMTSPAAILLRSVTGKILI